MRLAEHYLTFTSEKDKKEQYYDEVISIINKSYSSIGGAQSNATKSLLNPNVMWKLVTREGKVVAVLISKLMNGTRKAVLAGSDGSHQGKKDLQAIVKEEVKQLERHSWAEVSGAMEHIYVDKHGATLIPDTLAIEVMELLGKHVVPTGDGYHYTRSLGGSNEKHTKGIVGNEEQLRAFVDTLKSDRLSDSYEYKQIELAKSILESKGYSVKKVVE